MTCAAKGPTCRKITIIITTYSRANGLVHAQDRSRRQKRWASAGLWIVICQATRTKMQIFRDHRAARPDAEGWTPKHLTDRRQATKEGRRRIDPFQNLFVVLQDIAARPRGNKIKPRSTLVSTFGEHGIIAWEKPPLALQPTGHLRVWKCRQETYHADGDAGRLDAIDHFRSNCFGLGVETDDETGQNIHASRIDLKDALFQAAPWIPLLLYRDERVAVGTFDANENRKRNSPRSSSSEARYGRRG